MWLPQSASGSAHEFHVDTGQRVIYMRAPTAEDKLRWMLALNMKYKPPGRFDDEDEPELGSPVELATSAGVFAVVRPRAQASNRSFAFSQRHLSCPTASMLAGNDWLHSKACAHLTMLCGAARSTRRVRSAPRRRCGHGSRSSRSSC